MISNLSEIIESVIDPAQPSLSPHVFQNNMLRPEVRFKILAVWSAVNKVKPVARVLIVGGIATYNYTDNSDVDITLQLIRPSKEDLTAAQTVAKRHNGTEYAGPHEINYFARPDINYTNYDSVYDVIGNRWVKGPADVGVDIDRYLHRFEEIVEVIDADKAELLSDLADYGRLQKFSRDDLARATKRVESKLDEIEHDAQSLGDAYLEVWSARNSAFEEDDLTRIREYGSKNALPENVIYLLLRRYCYINFLHEIKKITDEGVDPEDVDDLEDAGEKFNRCQEKQDIESLISEALEDIPEEMPDEDLFEEPETYKVTALLHTPNWDREYADYLAYVDAPYHADYAEWDYDFEPDQLREGTVQSYSASLYIERAKAGDPFLVPEVQDFQIDHKSVDDSELVEGYKVYGVHMFLRGYESSMPDIPSTVEITGRVKCYLQFWGMHVV